MKKNNLINLVGLILSVICVITYWTTMNLSMPLYPLIGAFIACHGAFIGMLILTIKKW
jgi:hypothetical protein